MNLKNEFARRSPRRVGLVPTNKLGKTSLWLLLAGACVGLTPGMTRAQATDPAPQAEQPTDTATDDADPNAANQQTEPDQTPDPDPNQEPDPKEIPTAEVIEVSGTVEWAHAGVSPLAEQGWTPVQVGDRLQPGTQLRTALRAHVNLRFGETTVMSIRSATHASIDEFYRSATAEEVRIGLGYGTVRGSSSEGVLRSDVTVDSTVATLAKRGTEGFEMSVEPMTGRFRISLAQSGLVEAIRKMQGQRTLSKTVRPGEYATLNNIANLWIAQAVFDRNVTFYETTSITASDAEFSAYNSSGVGVVEPGGGSQLTNVSGRAGASEILRAAAIDPGRPPNMAIIQPGLLRRPEGNFGTPDTFAVFAPQEKRSTAFRSGLRGIAPGRNRTR